MKERPIIFNSEMVNAILEGRKTQTRRVIKPQLQRVGWNEGVFFKGNYYGLPKTIPFSVGDRLWVRETFALYQTVDYIVKPDGRSFNEISDGFAAYRADGHDSISDLKEHIKLMSDSSFEAVEVDGDKWKPSIHMPRWASRITLEVTDVRIERLLSIKYDEIYKEGIEEKPDPKSGIDHTRAERFMKLWNSIYGNWEDNPWVWVVEFKLFSPTRRNQLTKEN